MICFAVHVTGEDRPKLHGIAAVDSDREYRRFYDDVGEGRGELDVLRAFFRWVEGGRSEQLCGILPSLDRERIEEAYERNDRWLPGNRLTLPYTSLAERCQERCPGRSFDDVGAIRQALGMQSEPNLNEPAETARWIAEALAHLDRLCARAV